MNSKEEFLNYLRTIQFTIKKVLGFVNSMSRDDIAGDFSRIKGGLDKLIDILEKNEIRVNYLKQLRYDIDQIYVSIPEREFPEQEFYNLPDQVKFSFAEGWKVFLVNHLPMIDQFIFNLEFFDQIGFLENNVTAIGANGCGKSSLARKLSKVLEYNGSIISAQKALLLPTFGSIQNAQLTKQAIEKDRKRAKTFRVSNDFRLMQEEFGYIIGHLIADHVASNNDYAEKANVLYRGGKMIHPPEMTLLGKAKDIWNSLISHRELKIVGGMNLWVNVQNDEYEASNLSDGEKVILFNIGHVLLAPNDGFVIVDEPEMFLHKTILKKLWDILESEREDCIFIYLTHDLDFATSRINSEKKWIKEYHYIGENKERWTIQPLPDNEIPEPLLMQLLGSRKNILFCEGEITSYDFKLYSLLFPAFTIVPLKSCLNVINYTRAINRSPEFSIKAFGLVDSDFHDKERLEKLEVDDIYNFSVAEVENLFFDLEFLKEAGETFLAEEGFLEKHKEIVLDEFAKLKDIQIANYVSAKADYYFKDSNITKANDQVGVEKNLREFIDKIDIPGWFAERKEKLEKLIETNDYEGIVRIFNNKGLQKIASRSLGISNYIDRAIRLLRKSPQTQSLILKYFPDKLVKAGRQA